MKIASFILRFFLSLWFCFLIFRSGLYVKRIISETRQYFLTPANHPSKTFFPEIKPCSPKPPADQEEKYHLWQYRNFGVKCEK